MCKHWTNTCDCDKITNKKAYEEIREELRKFFNNITGE